MAVASRAQYWYILTHMQSAISASTIRTYTPLICLGFFAIIVSYYVIVPSEWVSSDIVMKYGHTVLWMLIGALFLSRRKKFVARHMSALTAVLLCGYIVFLIWFCARALSYVT